MNNLVSILAVGLLIALHEAGHFAAAVRVGMKVRKYSIGLLRAVASWTSKKSGIKYQIGILPLGGFVEIKGMNPFEEDADGNFISEVPINISVVRCKGHGLS